MFNCIFCMGLKLPGSKCLGVCIGLTFFIACYLASLPLPAEQTVIRNVNRITTHQSNRGEKKNLAIIVPFRDRFEELLEFVPHMHSFLKQQNIPYHIFVVQQKDSYRFNRASLINVGYFYTRDHYDYIAMHDVDLLPLNSNLSYDYPAEGPMHISSPETHPKYHYKTFIGGILLITREHYDMVNGMSNRYWGWGLEDDEFYVRLKDAKLAVSRPSNIMTGPENTFKHIHDRAYRRRDMRKCFNQLEVTRRRDRQTGLHDVAYKLTQVHELTIDNLPLTVLNVELLCDKSLTPWCQCPEAKPKNNTKVKS